MLNRIITGFEPLEELGFFLRLQRRRQYLISADIVDFIYWLIVYGNKIEKEPKYLSNIYSIPSSNLRTLITAKC